MINICIVEDDNLTTKLIKALIEKYPRIECIGTANDIISALKLIKNKKPDIVLFDVLLGNETAFDLLDCVENLTFTSIFMSGNKEFVFDALKYNAFDFLIKPINDIEFQNVINRALEKFLPKYVFLNVCIKGEKMKIEQRKIQYLKANGPYCLINSMDYGEIIYSRPLSTIEKMLCPQLFLRVHKSWIVNRNYILTTSSTNIILDKGINIPISRRKRKEIDTVK